MHRFIMQDVVDERVRLGSREEVFHTEKPAEGKPGQVRGGRMGRWQGREGGEATGGGRQAEGEVGGESGAPSDMFCHLVTTASP